MKKTKHYRSKVKTLHTNLIPFEDSLILIILNKCEKILHEILRGNQCVKAASLKKARENIISLDYDLKLIQTSSFDYGRIHSLVMSVHSLLLQKQQKMEQALKKTNEILELEKKYKVDKIDKAKTLIDKGIILGKLAQSYPQQYSEEVSAQLINEAILLIEKKYFHKTVSRQHAKLNQVLVTLFYFYATELRTFKSKKQLKNLYKKAYHMAVQSFGPEHHLTLALKNIISQYRKQIKIKRAVTQLDRTEMDLSTKSKFKKKKKDNELPQKKFRSFFKIYGCKTEARSQEKIELSEMKDLEKIKDIYKPKTVEDYLPKLIHNRKTIKDILLDKKNYSSQKPLIMKPSEEKIEKPSLIQVQEKMRKISVKDPSPKLKQQEKIFQDSVPVKEVVEKAGNKSDCAIM